MYIKGNVDVIQSYTIIANPSRIEHESPNLPGRRARKAYTQLASLQSTIKEPTYPNVSPSASWYIGVPFASAVSNGTVLPHQIAILFAPIVPFAGYCRQKKMITTATATPESKAAERT